MEPKRTMTNFFRLLVLVPHRDARLPLRAWSSSLFTAGLQGAWSFPWAAPLARLKRSLTDDELKLLARALRQEINNLALKGEVCCFGKVLVSGYIPFFERPKGRGMYPSLTINNAGGTLVSGPSLGNEDDCSYGQSITQKHPNNPHSNPAPYSVLPTPYSLYGTSLNFELSDDFFMPVRETVDCRFSPLVLGSALADSPLPGNLPAPPQVSFRAAALANMACRFLPADGDGENGYFFEWNIGPLKWLPKKLH